MLNMTVNDYRQMITEEINRVIESNVQIFAGNSNLEKINSICFDETTPLISKITTDLAEYTFDHVYDCHSDLYFGKQKVSFIYDKDMIRTTFFQLKSLKKLLQDFHTIEKICVALEELGAIDGTRQKLSALGKHYAENTELTSNALTKFQNKFRTTFTPDSFLEFKDAYMLSYEASREVFESKSEERRQVRRYAKNAVLNSYTGDVDTLVKWLKTSVEYIQVKVPTIHDEDYANILTSEGTRPITKSVAEIKEKVIENTESLVQEADNRGLVDPGFEITSSEGMYSVWIIKLKAEAKSSIPEEVLSWRFLKKKSHDLDSYEEGLVYREKQNTITGNPIVKDLVFNFNLKLKAKV